jgi:hypothetical protein
MMTENEFMIVDALEKMPPLVIKGGWDINKHITNNPQWWLLEIFDGFNARLLYHKANEEFLNAKILPIT